MSENYLILIKRNDERYPDLIREHHPKVVSIFGTAEQAKFVAEALSTHDLAGCEYFYYVEDLE